MEHWDVSDPFRDVVESLSLILKCDSSSVDWLADGVFPKMYSLS